MSDPFYERFSAIETKKKEISDYKTYNSYKLRAMIVKSNDDLRQEVLAMQIIKRMKTIF